LKRALVVAWKDALEFLRDRKSIGLMVVSAFLFPLLGLLVTGLASQQRALVVVRLCDEGSHVEAFTEAVRRSLESLGWVEVRLVEGGPCGAYPNATLTIVVPRGFEANASSIDRPVVVRVYKLVGSSAAAQLESVVSRVAGEFSHSLAVQRVERLAGLAGLRVEAENVLNPLRLATESVTVGGGVVGEGVEARVQLARFLAFAVFFVLNPAAIAVADSVARERESGTGELIAVTPIRGGEFVVGKALGSLAAVALAGAVDTLAALVYSGLSPGGLDAGLVALHAVETMLAVFATAALTILATMLLPGQRTATLVTSLITATATMVFFASLFVDFENLPLTVRVPLYLIPYTYTVMAIKSYALGDAGAAAVYTAALAVAAAAALAAAAAVYRPSRMVKRG